LKDFPLRKSLACRICPWFCPTRDLCVLGVFGAPGEAWPGLSTELAWFRTPPTAWSTSDHGFSERCRNKNDRAVNKAEKQARILERRPLVKELEQLEINISKWHIDKKVCDDRLNENELYTAADKTELQSLLKKQAELANQIEIAEETPLAQEDITPNFSESQITIAKTLFAGLSDAELIEIIEAGFNKFKLIGEAEAEHWSEFRENLDKLTVAFVIAGTDDESPHDKEEVMPLFGQLLSQLCEAFENV
jgi:hypothetical protein